MPKCGSQTMSMLINQLARRNGFYSQAVFVANEKPERTPTEQTAFMKELSDTAYSKQKNVLYTRHQYYITPDAFDFDAKERGCYTSQELFSFDSSMSSVVYPLEGTTGIHKFNSGSNRQIQKFLLFLPLWQ